MAKVPRPGTVKTRLRPLLSDVQSAKLATCFLRDTVAKAARLTPNVVIAYSPDDGEAEIAALLPGQHLYIAQKGVDLGERLQSAVAVSETLGFGPIVLVGTDSPTLPDEYIHAAFKHLAVNEKGIAVGPADDGGYYLIGMSRAESELFRGIEWSSKWVFEQTMANARNISKTRIIELPRWYDVDTADDLARLCIELEADENARSRAPETFRWIAAHRELFAAGAETVESFSCLTG